MGGMLIVCCWCMFIAVVHLVFNWSEFLHDAVKVGLHDLVSFQELVHGRIILGMLISKVGHSSVEGGGGVKICCNVGKCCTTQRILVVLAFCPRSGSNSLMWTNQCCECYVGGRNHGVHLKKHLYWWCYSIHSVGSAVCCDDLKKKCHITKQTTFHDILSSLWENDKKKNFRAKKTYLTSKRAFFFFHSMYAYHPKEFKNEKCYSTSHFFGNLTTNPFCHDMMISLCHHFQLI